eukprot:1829768-Alexandrium_andersonii.AAC.1
MHAKERAHAQVHTHARERVHWHMHAHAHAHVHVHTNERAQGHVRAHACACAGMCTGALARHSWSVGRLQVRSRERCLVVGSVLSATAPPGTTKQPCAGGFAA